MFKKQFFFCYKYSYIPGCIFVSVAVQGSFLLPQHTKEEHDLQAHVDKHMISNFVIWLSLEEDSGNQ